MEGKFGGFGYDTNSQFITLQSDELCNQRGAGLIFGTLWSYSESKKLHTTQKETRVVLEGTVFKIEQDRFVHLNQGLVHAVH